MIDTPDSRYIFLVTHKGVMVGRQVRIDPPMNELVVPLAATTLFDVPAGARAFYSFSNLASIPGKSEEPPVTTILL